MRRPFRKCRGHFENSQADFWKLAGHSGNSPAISGTRRALRGRAGRFRKGLLISETRRSFAEIRLSFPIFTPRSPSGARVFREGARHFGETPRPCVRAPSFRGARARCGEELVAFARGRPFRRSARRPGHMGGGNLRTQIPALLGSWSCQPMATKLLIATAGRCRSPFGVPPGPGLLMVWSVAGNSSFWPSTLL